MSSYDLATIQRFGTPQEAHLARSVLDAAGIEACVTDESAATWLWHVGTALGGTRVQVAAHDAERARQVLQQAESPGAERAHHDWQCPRCGAEVDAGFDVCWSCESPHGENSHDFEQSIQARSTLPISPPSAVADSPAELPGDADAARAWRAAMFGIFFPPLYLYALYLILKTVNRELSSRGMRQFCGALGISLLAVTLFVSLIANWR